MVWHTPDRKLETCGAIVTPTSMFWTRVAISTCHSQYWMEQAEAKFKQVGYEVGWASKEGKVFSRLGSQGDKTQGCRVLPFSLNTQDDQNLIRGILESHQLQEGRSPMLLSLHAQSHLGLVKDLAKGTIHIEGRQLPIFRCSKTGLSMISLTGGLIDAARSVIESSAVATWLETLHVATNEYEAAFTGQRFSRQKDAQVAIDLAQTQVLIASKGSRYEQPLYRGEVGRRPLLRVDLKNLNDPDRDKTMSAHIGTHPRI